MASLAGRDLECALYNCHACQDLIWLLQGSKAVKPSRKSKVATSKCAEVHFMSASFKMPLLVLHVLGACHNFLH